jgi:hypothetical protein
VCDGFVPLLQKTEGGRTSDVHCGVRKEGTRKHSQPVDHLVVPHVVSGGLVGREVGCSRGRLLVQYVCRARACRLINLSVGEFLGELIA